MKDLIKRIITITLFVIIATTFLILVARCSKEKSYKYLTFDNIWGESSNCYEDEERRIICVVDSELVKVRQYYES